MDCNINYEELYDYAETHSNTGPAYLEEITRETHLLLFDPHMISSPIQGRFLSFISKLLKPNLILEIGTFVGYSALCLAEGLTGNNAQLITIERNEELKNIIEKNISKSPFYSLIHLFIDDATHVLESNTIDPLSVDLIYIDADKRQYPQLLQLCIPLLKKNGILIADNTLWAGHIIDDAYEKDAQTKSIKLFNQILHDKKDLEPFILPAFDGISLARKL